MSDTLVLGAVAYDAKVVTIWDGFRHYLLDRGLNFDYILFSNYERQVAALLDGQIDFAWNSPLAWLNAQSRAAERGLSVEAIAMRDTDCDNRSVIVTRADSDVTTLEELRAKVVATGASDSPQATLIPLLMLQRAGLLPERDFVLQRHEVLVGLHGDHVGGERDAASALIEGRADAACLHEANYVAFIGDGLFPPLQTTVLAYTPRYDHCNMTAGPAASRVVIDRFRDELLAMSYSDEAVKPLFDLEGLHEWREARISGYSLLNEALEVLQPAGL